MRIVDPKTGKSYVEKRRVRYNEPGDAPEQLSAFLQAVKEPSARKAIRYWTDNAPEWLARVTVREGRRAKHRFWQPGGGYDRNIPSTEVLRAVIEYIQANPVGRALVTRADDWEWSSARWSRDCGR